MSQEKKPPGGGTKVHRPDPGHKTLDQSVNSSVRKHQQDVVNTRPPPPDPTTPPADPNKK